MGRVTHTDEPLTPFQVLEGPAEVLSPGRVSLAPLAMSSAKFLFRRYEHPILPFPHSPSLHLTHLTHPRVGFPSLFVPGAAAVKPPGLKRLRTQATLRINYLLLLLRRSRRSQIAIVVEAAGPPLLEA